MEDRANEVSKAISFIGGKVEDPALIAHLTFKIRCSCQKGVEFEGLSLDDPELHEWLGEHTTHGCRFKFGKNGEFSKYIEIPKSQKETQPQVPLEKPVLEIDASPSKQVDTEPEGQFKEQPTQEETEGGRSDLEGWIKLHRKILDNPIMKDSEAFHLLGYFLLKTNHKAKRFLFNQQEIILERGQLITGLARISNDTGLTHREIRTRLALLENLGILTRKTTNRFSIITICNYNQYQDSKNGERQAKRQTKDLSGSANQLVLGGQSSDNQTTTNKNDKNIKHYVEGSDELRLANLLLEEIQRNKVDHGLSPFKQPDLQTWAREIDLMIRRDGRKPGEIEKVIRWCQGHDFWWKNILSTQKLRRQFDRLEAAMGGGFSRKSGVEYEDLTGCGEENNGSENSLSTD